MIPGGRLFEFRRQVVILLEAGWNDPRGRLCDSISQVV